MSGNYICADADRAYQSAKHAVKVHFGLQALQFSNPEIRRFGNRCVVSICPLRNAVNPASRYWLGFSEPPRYILKGLIPSYFPRERVRRTRGCGVADGPRAFLPSVRSSSSLSTASTQF